MTRIYVIAAICALLVAGAVYLRWDATQDERARAEAARSAERIDQIQDDRRADDEVSRLDDSGLFSRASEWLLGGDE